MKHDRFTLVHVVQQKHPRSDGRDHPVEVGTLHPTRAHLRTLQAIQEALLIPVCLHPANEPRPGIGQSLVVQIHRVLGGEHQAKAKGSRLFQQGKQGFLGRRIGWMGRQVAKQLVHVKQRPQAGGSSLGSHPAYHLFE
jgi:hypothetical protein